jgi:hypothetical protein
VHPITPYARTAYAQGWAASGGPMTDRVKAGCVAAVEHACAHADDPDVIEVTLRLGRLEGTWAAVYDQREKVHAEAERQALALWRAAVQSLDLSALVQQATDQSPDTPAAQRRDTLTATATAILSLLWTTPQWEQLRAYLTAVYGEAYAHGWAAAAAIHAEQRGTGGPDLADLAATVPPDNSAAGPLAVLKALSGIVMAAARTLARTLARQPATTGPDDTEDTLDEGTDLALGVDMLTGGSYMAGLLAFLASIGADRVNFLTAGDGRVCAACEDAEDNNPYRLSDVPAPPLHPRCRCVLST